MGEEEKKTAAPKIAPIPPPKKTQAAEEPKKKRGRPPGSKTKRGKKERDSSESRPLIGSVEELKAILCTISKSAQQKTAGKGGAVEKLGAALGWHRDTEALIDGKKVLAVEPSWYLDTGADLVFPYAQETGIFDLAELTSEAKFTIGCAVLLAPAALTAFQLAIDFAFPGRRAARDREVPGEIVKKDGEEKKGEEKK